METLQALIPVLFSASLMAMVFSFGLDATPADLGFLIRRPNLLTRALLAICVIVPACALLVVALSPMNVIAKAGILIMAASPVPPLVPGKELKLGGRKSYIYGLYAAISLLAIITVPLTVAIFAAFYQRDVSIALMAIARNVSVSVLAPLCAGLAVAHWFPRFASSAKAWVFKTSLALLFAAALPLLISVWPGFLRLAGDGALFGMAVVVAVALAAGHWLGGPDPRDRVALALATATRHPGIALLIVGANTQNKDVSAAVLLYLVVSLVVAAPYQMWVKRSGVAHSASRPQH